MMTKMLLVVIGVLSLAVAFLFVSDQHHRRVAFENALARDSVEAINDTTRAVLMSTKDSAKILGDSLSAVTMRSVQLQMQRDAMDKASHTTSTSRTNVGTHVESVAGSVTSPARTPSIDEHSLETPNDVRHATFNVRRIPFTVRAAVAIPKAGDASLDYNIALDDASIGVRTTCGDVVRGVRQASVLFTSPQWLHLNVTSSEQSADVCNAKNNAQTKRARRWGIGATIGYGGVFARDSSKTLTLHHGIGGTFGLSFRF